MDRNLNLQWLVAAEHRAGCSFPAVSARVVGQQCELEQWCGDRSRPVFHEKGGLYRYQIGWITCTFLAMDTLQQRYRPEANLNRNQ